MSRQDLKLKTADGEMPAYAFTADKGPASGPGVIMYMDAFGIRPSLFDMAQRMADMGYVVLVPDMYWRIGPYEPMDVGHMLAHMDELMKLIGTTNPEKSMSDTQACLDWFAAQPNVTGEKVGTMGYCMGGGMALRAAGTFPDKVGAAGAFHAGNVVTDAPNSIHLLAAKTKAKVLVAGADQDSMFTEEHRATLEKAYKDAGVDAEVVIWEGKLHGYAPKHMPVYDEEASERHYKEADKLFKAAL